jgi:hypothetical protein
MASAEAFRRPAVAALDRICLEHSPAHCARRSLGVDRALREPSTDGAFMTTDDQPDIAAQEPGPRRKRSGSESRKRPGSLSLRLNAEERRALEAAAEAQGMSLGGYIRSRVLATATTHARRRASGEILALARLQGELNRIGGILYKLQRHVNSGSLTDPLREVHDAFLGYQEAIAAVMAATTRIYGDRLPGPEPEPEDDDEAEVA